VHPISKLPTARNLDVPAAGRAYESLRQVEHAFRSPKTLDVKIRPIHLRTRKNFSDVTLDETMFLFLARQLDEGGIPDGRSRSRLCANADPGGTAFGISPVEEAGRPRDPVPLRLALVP
jgi:hypothetical protein